jgi:hypothetical protein
MLHPKGRNTQTNLFLSDIRKVPVLNKKGKQKILNSDFVMLDNNNPPYLST